MPSSGTVGLEGIFSETSICWSRPLTSKSTDVSLLSLAVIFSIVKQADVNLGSKRKQLSLK